ncbi:hypothetical protein [Spongorhabdus nitratireducens]
MTSTRFSLIRPLPGLLLTILLTNAGLTSAAAPEISDEQREKIEQQLQDTKARLKLTPEQEAKLTPILEASREKRMEVFEKYGLGNSGERKKLSFREKRALGKEMKTLRTETNKQVKEVLSEDQYNEYLVIQDERKQKMRERIQNRNS